MTYPLGRNVEHDPQSWDYPAPMRRVLRKRNVIHLNGAPILDQGQLGSCVGNTAAEWLNCAIAFNNRKRGATPTRRPSHRYLTQTNAVELYSEATRRDEDEAVQYPPDDTGTSGLGVAKALQAWSFIEGYMWTFSMEHFLATLALQPVCVGINWYTGMFDPDLEGYVYPTGSVEGGHEVLARGIDYTRSRVLFRNHWRADWGRAGECWMTFDVVKRLLDEDGDVMVPRLGRPIWHEDSPARLASLI